MNTPTEPSPETPSMRRRPHTVGGLMVLVAWSAYWLASLAWNARLDRMMGLVHLHSEEAELAMGRCYAAWDLRRAGDPVPEFERMKGEEKDRFVATVTGGR